MKRTKKGQEIYDKKVKSNWAKIRRLNDVLIKAQQVIDRFKEANPSLIDDNNTKRKEVVK